MSNWKFITNHGAVLVLLDQQRKITAREIANKLGITERSIARILSDLEQEDYIERDRQGRRNVYRLKKVLSLRHEIARDIAIGDFLKLFQ